MDWRVIWTELAWDDLEQVLTYIAKDSPHYAGSFGREVREAARSLMRFAERGRRVPEFETPSIREIFVRSYRLIYSLSPEAVCILAFIHGARDLQALFKREGRPQG